MKDENEQFEQLPEELIRLMKRSQQPSVVVPSEMDDAMLDAARQSLKRSSSKRWPMAIAAMLLLSLGLGSSFLIYQHNQLNEPVAYELAPQQQPTILDAFELARLQVSGQAIDARWDANEDGKVDSADVDYLAQLAVKLGGNDQG